MPWFIISNLCKSYLIFFFALSLNMKMNARFLLSICVSQIALQIRIVISICLNEILKIYCIFKYERLEIFLWRENLYSSVNEKCVLQHFFTKWISFLFRLHTYNSMPSIFRFFLWISLAVDWYILGPLLPIHSLWISFSKVC